MLRLAFTSGLTLALGTIRAHKMRAFLTVLGVIIGTGTIIGVGAILTGFDKSITAVLRSFGPNSIIVFKFPVGFRVTDLSPEERTRKNLTFENAAHIRERARSVQEVTPMLFPNQGFINAHYKGNDMYDVNIFGVEPSYTNGGQVDLHVGRFFSDEENRRRAPVAVLGEALEKALFANVDPVGKEINIDGHAFQVIGTMIRPAASFFGDQDNRVVLPYWTMQKMYPNARENALVVTAADGRLAEAQDEIRTILRMTGTFPITSRMTLRSPPPIRWWPISADHRHDLYRHGRAQLRRSDGGRNRSHEYHAGFGNRAHFRNWYSQSYRRAAHGNHHAISAGSHGAHRSGRNRRNCFWLDCGHHQPPGVPFPAGNRAVVGRRSGDRGFRGRGSVLWHLARQQGRPAGSGCSFALRVTRRT
jgi:MacB-like periplasmic core domain